MLCRLCLNESPHYFHIYGSECDETYKLDISEIIWKYTQIQIRKDDETRNIICKQCWYRLADFHQFCSTIKENQDLLEQQYPRSHCSFDAQSIVKVEEVDVDDIDIHEQLHDELQDIVHEKSDLKTKNNSGPSTLAYKVNKCFQEIAVLRNENKLLKRKLIQYKNDNCKIHDRLYEEIAALKANVPMDPMNVHGVKSILPKTPISEFSDFVKFEQEIQKSKENFELLENEIYKINIIHPSKYVRVVWKRILTDEVAVNLTWKNAKNKSSLNDLAITAAFRDAFKRKFTDELQFKKITSKFFQTAKERLKYGLKRK